MNVHLDIAVDDLEAGVVWAVELGARLAGHQPQEDVRVMLDPVGHPFCLFEGEFESPQHPTAARFTREWQESLPAPLNAGRLMGAGALIRDQLGRVLLVKPTYKPAWEVPGGAIEVGESPRSCCRRELFEELGLELPIGRLLVFDWLPANPPRPDGWMYLFDGGLMTELSASRIVLQHGELAEWRFVDVSALDQFLPAHRARRVRVAHACSLSGSSADLEWGYPAGGDREVVDERS